MILKTKTPAVDKSLRWVREKPKLGIFALEVRDHNFIVIFYLRPRMILIKNMSYILCDGTMHNIVYVQ
jgi:hypothetical protein